MKNAYWLIGLGGALGAVARVALMSILPSFILQFPLKILIINVIGCFAIGILTGLFSFYTRVSPSLSHFLIQGFLGGFTTFSAFALEFGLVYEKGFHFTAIFYALISLVLSIGFFFLGLKFYRILTLG